MSEVTRYAVIETALCIGSNLMEGEVFMVMATDHDRELAALREELDGYRAANMVLRDELKTERLRADAAVGDANDAERSLAAAEQRNAELVAASEKALEVFRSMLRDQRCGMHYASAQAACHQINAALKPTESGASE